jgi:hypothetical protein
MKIDELGRAVGNLCWIERRLFALLGGWASSLPVVEAKAMVATHSAQHGWHSQLWRERIPEANGADGEVLVACRDERTAEAFALLQLVDDVEPLALLSGVYAVVLPWLARQVEQLISSTSIDTDPTTIRICSLVGADVRLASREGDELVQGLINTSDALSACAAMCAALIELLDERSADEL